MSPVAVRSGGPFQSLDYELLSGDGRRTSISAREHLTITASSGGGIQCLSSTLQVDGVEGRRVVEDGLLAGVEIGELMVVEYVEAAGEVAVDLETCVVPRSPRVGT